MASSLYGKLGINKQDFRQTIKYKAFVESVRSVLMSDPAGEIVSITGEQSYLFRGDLTGLFLSLGIPFDHHFMVMRVNEFTSRHELDETVTAIFKPSASRISMLENLYSQSLGK